MQIETFPTKTELGYAIAKHVLNGIHATNKNRFVLGVPTGATPIPFFEAFISLTKELSETERGQIAKKLYLLAMDDFVDPATRMNIPASDEWSAIGFINHNFLNALQATLFPAHLDDNCLLVPKPGQIGILKKQILENGGIDMQIIATDPYEGHVAQNFSGQSFNKTEGEKYAPLSDAFLKHHDWAEKYLGITFGLDDFLEMVSTNSHGQFLLMLWGAAKHPILQQLLDRQSYDPRLPLSFLHLAEKRTLIFTDYHSSKRVA